MTIVMSEKNQITIPKKIADILHLKRGSMFDVEIHRNRIELVPLEKKEMAFTTQQYKKLDDLCHKEKGQEHKMTKEMIHHLKQGKT